MKKLVLLALAALPLLATAQTVPSYVPTNGLDGWWSFNGNANDLSGNGNNGTVIGATSVPDRNNVPNGAYLFNGSTDYIALASPFFQGSTNVTAFTYFFEFKISQIPAANTAMALSCKEGFWRGLDLAIYPDGSIAFRGSQPNPQGYLSIASPSNTISPNQYYCVAVTFSSGALELFVNGISVASNTTAYSALDFSWVVSGNSTATNYCGACHPVSPGITDFFNGVVDNMGTWSRVLSAQEINGLCQNCQNSITTQPANQSLVSGNNAVFTTASSDPNATYQWQTDLGLGFQNLSNAGQYSGATNDTLTVTSVNAGNNNQAFRCIVSSGTCTDTTQTAYINITTGITEENNSSFTVFPNPATNNITVTWAIPNVNTLTLSDATGRAVRTYNVTGTQAQLSLEGLASGVYFLSVGGEEKAIQMIIKN